MVFAQKDCNGDARFAGVAKAFCVLGVQDNAILQSNDPRNTAEVDDAGNQVRSQNVVVKR